MIEETEQYLSGATVEEPEPFKVVGIVIGINHSIRDFYNEGLQSYGITKDSAYMLEIDMNKSRKLLIIALAIGVVLIFAAFGVIKSHMQDRRHKKMFAELEEKSKAPLLAISN